MGIEKQDIDAFENAVVEKFEFLVNDFGMRYSGVNWVDDDPRDSYIVTKYRNDELRVDIAWNPFAMSLNIVVRVPNEELRRREKSIYFEPFIEFITSGKIEPVIPQIYPNMTVTKIENAMRLRETFFSEGIEQPLNEIARRLQQYFGEICKSSNERILKFQVWYQDYGKHD